MSKQELINKLNELGINTNYYSLDGPVVEGLVIDVSKIIMGIIKLIKNGVCLIRNEVIDTMKKYFIRKPKLIRMSMKDL
ncbi:MAG: hypothetical protein JWR50_2058 [Mucilaginibacter sp.]|nr:hypothetical protein [Mucilaginibacter sp.]